jgi:hypothetical protein
MRTTVVIDDDVLKHLREKAHRGRRSLKDVLNEALRTGLEPNRRAGRRKPYACPSFPMGRPAPGVDLDRALRLADALADDETARKLQLRK